MNSKLNQNNPNEQFSVDHFGDNSSPVQSGDAGRSSHVESNMEATTPTKRLQQLLPRLFSEERVTGERYLLFQLSPDLKAAISLEQVWEATVIPTTAITPIPQMPSYILGWNNGRDRVYCILSLQELVGLTTVTQMPQQYSVIVANLSPKIKSVGDPKPLLVGMAVHRILRTIRISQQELVSAVGEFPSELTPYLSGCIQREQQQIAVVDLNLLAENINKSPQLK